MNKLPQTHEEFTQFALENAGSRVFFDHVLKIFYDKSIVFKEYTKITYEYTQWIKYVYENFPDIVSYYRPGPVDIRIYFAGVLVSTYDLCRSYNIDLAALVAQHYQDTTS